MKRASLWQEGYAVDLWSLNHFVSGWWLGFFILLLFNSAIAFTIAVSLFVLWEFLEILIKTGEVPANQVLDVIFSIAGFLLQLLTFSLLQSTVGHVIIGIVIFIWLMLETKGYLYFFRNKKT